MDPRRSRPSRGNSSDGAAPSAMAAVNSGDSPSRSKIASTSPARPLQLRTRFYRDLNGIAERDSWLVEKLRAAGAVITGKTHLHPLAYGITGENPDFGDCVQPQDPGALTGGSSSGAGASIMEGSAVAAIGTDTGGSIRVPAALCGFAGYRASLGRGNWRGGRTWLPRSTPWAGFFAISKRRLCSAASSRRTPGNTRGPLRDSVSLTRQFPHDCEPDVVASYRGTIARY